MILTKVLMLVGILVLLLAAAQMTMALFSSFRAPKFIIGMVLVALGAVWGLVHLYAVTFIAPGYGEPSEPAPSPSVTEAATPSPEATETPTEATEAP